MNTQESNFVSCTNGGSIAVKEIPELDIADFDGAILSAVRDGMRVSALFGAKTKKKG